MLKFTRQQDAILCARALNEQYPSYVLRAEKPAGDRTWKIACYGKRDGVADCFLQFYRG